jgi:hypothetical protein
MLVHYNVHQLRKYLKGCKQPYWKMKKAELLRHAAAKRIQHWYRSMRNHYVNTEDFLSLEPLPTARPLFRHRQDNGCIYRFDPESLAEYLCKTGLFRNPYTQAEFECKDLMRLDHCIERMGLDTKYPSFAEDGDDIVRQCQLEREEQSTLELLYYECISTFQDMFRQTGPFAPSVPIHEQIIQFMEFNYRWFIERWSYLYRMSVTFAMECMIDTYHRIHEALANPTITKEHMQFLGIVQRQLRSFWDVYWNDMRFPLSSNE